MEESKLISNVIAKLKLAYPSNFNRMENEELLGMIKLYEPLNEYDSRIVLKVIDNIVRTKKFMPTLAEILEDCENCIDSYELDIINKMKDDGYFHDVREYEKITMWLSEGIIPKWFLEDMKKYGYQDMRKGKLLENNTRLAIENKSN